MFREGLIRMLEREQDLKVVGEFASSSEALQSLDESEADVALLDVDLGAERQPRGRGVPGLHEREATPAHRRSVRARRRSSRSVTA